MVETGSRVAHCPVSNLFLASGMMPLGQYLEAGLVMGLGSDVAAGPDLSIFSAMRVGFYVQNARKNAGVEDGPILTPLEWLRLGSLGGAQALGLDERRPGRSKPARRPISSPSTRPTSRRIDGWPADEDPADLASRLIFRAHPDMVRGAWVRGRRLEGPAAR